MTTAIYDFWNNGDKEHTFHPGDPWPNETRGNLQFYAFSSQVHGTEEICDFWNPKDKEHTFHKGGPWPNEDRGHVQFYAFPHQFPATEAVFDFWNQNDKEHTFHMGEPWQHESRGNVQFWAYKEPLVWFRWAQCDGLTAEERARWLVNERGLSEESAQLQVMSEFPVLFMSPQGGKGDGKGDHHDDSGKGKGKGKEPAGCLKCSGKGFCHESAMQHDKGPFEKCFFCTSCPSCCSGAGGLQRCFKCEGKGFVHESSMRHDKGPQEKCFFCSPCAGCGGSGHFEGGKGDGKGAAKGHAVPPQRCFKCDGKGFTHESSMNHDKGPREKCFFCTSCTGCHGSGHL